MDVKLPDGTVVQNVPDGISKADLVAKLQKNGMSVPDSWLPKQPAPAADASQPDQNTQGALGFLKNLYGGGVEPAMSLASGAIAKPASDIAGLAGIVGNATGIAPNDPAQTKDSVQNAMTYQPRSQAGQATMGLLGQVGDQAKQLTDQIGQGAGNLARVASGGQSNGVTDALQNGASEAAQQAMNVDAPEAVEARAKPVADLPAPSKPSPTTIEATRQEAVQAGLKITPNQAGNVSGVAGNLASIGGSETKLQQAFTKYNASQAAPQIVKQDLGLPVGEELTQKSIDNVTSKANSAYQGVRAIGDKIGPVTIPGDIKAIQDKYGVGNPPPTPPGAAKPPTLDPVTLTQKPDTWTTGGMLDTVAQLRADARAGFKATDNPVALHDARAAWSAADNLDTFMQKTLADEGYPEVAANYVKARTMLAKVNSVQDAFNPATGSIDASSLAKDWNGGKGMPLSGGLLTLAKAADAFPSVMKAPEGMPTTGKPTAVDAFLVAKGVAGAVTGHPAALGDVLSGGMRPLARNKVSSRDYQLQMVGLGRPTPPRPGLPSLPQNVGRGAAQVGNSLGMGALSGVPMLQGLQRPQQ